MAILINTPIKTRIGITIPSAYMRIEYGIRANGKRLFFLGKIWVNKESFKKEETTILPEIFLEMPYTTTGEGYIEYKLHTAFLYALFKLLPAEDQKYTKIKNAPEFNLADLEIADIEIPEGYPTKLA